MDRHRELALDVPQPAPLKSRTLRESLLRQHIAFVDFMRARASLALSATALVCIVAGTGAFAREAQIRHETISWQECLYNTMGLFAFAGNRFGFPQTALLTVVYFLAPLVSASALFEAMFRLAGERNSLLLVGLRGHNVVCGLGSIGALVARHLDEKGQFQVLVDLRDDARNIGALGEQRDIGAHLMVHGDMTSLAVLQRCRAQRARTVWLTADNDMVNLRAVAQLRTDGGVSNQAHPLIYCQIRDPDLLRQLRADQLKVAPQTRSVSYFDGHELAAKALIAKLFSNKWLPELRLPTVGHLTASSGVSVEFAVSLAEPTPRRFVIVGLGRFGRAVLDQLLVLAPVSSELVAIDLRQSAVSAAVAGLSRSAGQRVTAVVGEVSAADWQAQMDRWVPSNSATNGTVPTTIVLLCTDNDKENLKVALRLATKKYPTVVRMFDQAVLSDKISHETLESVGPGHLGVAEFQSLFRTALPMLIASPYDFGEGECGTPCLRSRILACVHPDGGGSGKALYLATLSPADLEAIKGSGAVAVPSPPLTNGETADLVDDSLWLLTAAALERLAPRD